MSRVNRNQIPEQTKCSPHLSTSPSAYCSVSPPSNSPTLSSGSNDAIRRSGNQCNPMFKPNELLQGYNDDMNMLRPLLMYNLENIQSYRADCKYKRSRIN